jgi:iron complex transport system permease protein
VLVALLALSVVLMALGLGVGSTGWAWPWGQGGAGAVEASIVWQIRWPRSAGAWLVGALLGLAGAVAQGVFRNPLADPYLLGSAAGGALGVTLVLVIGLVAGTGGGPTTAHGWAAIVHDLSLTGAAFVGALAATALALSLARGVSHTPRLLLAGVVVGVVLGAVTSALLWRWPQLLPPLQAFMLGSTSLLDGTGCLVLLMVLALGLGITLATARGLDLLTLGEATAASLGLPLRRLRLTLLGVMSLATGAAVAQVGLVAFVGLAAPHIVRSVLQVPHRWLLPLSALVGGVLLLMADVLARGLSAPAEWPVGLLTAVAGGGYLLWRLR